MVLVSYEVEKTVCVRETFVMKHTPRDIYTYQVSHSYNSCVGNTLYGTSELDDMSPFRPRHVSSLSNKRDMKISLPVPCLQLSSRCVHCSTTWIRVYTVD